MCVIFLQTVKLMSSTTRGLQTPQQVTLNITDVSCDISTFIHCNVRS